MRRIHESIEIAAPIETVFEFVADFRNALKWMHGFHKFEAISKETVGQGARVQAAGKLRGFPITTELEIVEFVPNRKIVSLSRSVVKSTSAWLFEPTERGTIVSFVAQYEPPRGLVGSFANMALRKELADHTWKSLVKLKRIVEALHSEALRSHSVASTSGRVSA